MKLAIARQTYTPFGGAERIIERALEVLRSRGVDTTIIARNWQGHSASVACNPFYLGRTWRDYGFSKCVQKIITSSTYDLVQAHERIPGCHLYRAGDGVHASWLAARAATPSRRFSLADTLSPYHRFILRQEKAMYAHPQLRQVICNSRMVADELRELYDMPERQLTVIYNGVDPLRFHPGLVNTHRTNLRTELGIPFEQTVLLFVGNGFRRKGVPALIDAFRTMQRQDALLLIVGEDRERRKMMARVDELKLSRQIRFLGARQDVERFYAAADGFALPSLYDPCPNAALEAMACGLPTLVSDRSGSQEWISSGQNGFVAPTANIDALAESLDALCALGQNARKAAHAAVAHLTLDAMANRWLHLYTDLLKVA